MRSGGLVSVIIPFYNTPPDFLREAIESVRAQTSPAWELILANDGSTGGALEVARNYAASDPDRIRLVEHPGGRNRGHSATRNLGLEHAAGDFVNFLDADDLLLPHKLIEQLQLLHECPAAQAIYGRTEYWHSWRRGPDEPAADFVPDLGIPAGTLARPPALLPLYLRGLAAVPCTCSLLVRVDCARAVGGFESSFRALYGDQAFYAKLSLTAPILVAGGLWDRYRQHPESLTGRTRKVEERANRTQFLDWLERYMRETGLGDGAVRRALAAERWKLRHPRVARALRSGRRVARRFGWRPSPSV